MSTTKKAYSVAEFAEAYDLCEATVRNMIRRGELRSLRMGRRVLIPASEHDRLAGEGEVAA